MAITVTERWRSGRINVAEETTIDTEHVVAGTTNAAEALNAIVTKTPFLLEGLARTGMRITGRASETKWYGEVTYGTGGGSISKLTGTSSFSFDIRSESIHITHAPVIQAAVVAGKNFENRQGGMGWDGEKFEGVDVPVPVYSFSETHYLNTTVVTGSYKAALFAIAANPVNSGTFRGFAAGEVMFLGASGSLRSVNQWEITYSFAAQPNLTGLTIGTMTGINKNGWDYLNVEFKADKDDTAKNVFKIPRQVTVHRPLGRSNFAGLGIGTT